MAEQNNDIWCITYTNERAAEFYQSVNEYLDKHSGINGSIISPIAFQFFAHSQLKKADDNNDDENNEIKQEQDENNKDNRYLILQTSKNEELTKQTMIAAVVQLESVIFLSTFNNIDLNNTQKLTKVIQILCATGLNPITNAAGLEICGDKLIIDLLINELKLSALKKKEMQQTVYALYSTKKYETFCVERIKKCKLKIENIGDKNKSELFGHLIEANDANERHIKMIKEWYPQFCKDVGLNFNIKSMNAFIRNIKSKKVYFWGREKRKMIETDKDKEEEKKEKDVAHAYEYDLVSLASITGYTPHMARIGFVYTPMEERRKGYATHLVGCLSQIMEKEKKMVWIIADKTNLASNKAYTRIGFNLESTSTLIIFS